ncbi:MAG: hypothetical protein IJU84_04135 [Clostridia bacterium]|nr:hypothetical protein [Clostridia bacterium]
MKRKLFAFLFASVLAALSAGGVAVVSASGEITDSASFIFAVENGGEVTLGADIDFGGTQVQVNGTVRIDGNGHKLSNVSLALNNADSSFIENITISGSSDNGIVVSDSLNVRFQSVLIENSAGYGLVERGTTKNTTVTVNNGIEFRGNGSGAILLENKCIFTLRGSAAVFSVNEKVYIPAAVSAYVHEGDEYKNKNFDKENKLNVACVTESGSFFFRDTDGINQLSYTSGGKTYKCYVFPYDETPPSVDVIGAKKQAVVNTEVDLKNAVSVRDNTTPADLLKIDYSAKYANGKVLTVSDGVIVPSEQGKLEITLSVRDEYDNVTVRRIYIEIIPAYNVKPVISSPFISRMQTVGKTFILPEFSAVDEDGDDATVTIKITDTDNAESEVTDGKYVFAKAGSYILTVYAEDKHGVTAEKRYYLAAVSDEPTVINQTADTSESGKKGCKSSMEAASVLIAGVMFAGAYLIKRKKK